MDVRPAKRRRTESPQSEDDAPDELQALLELPDNLDLDESEGEDDGDFHSRIMAELEIPEIQGDNDPLEEADEETAEIEEMDEKPKKKGPRRIPARKRLTAKRKPKGVKQRALQNLSVGQLAFAQTEAEKEADDVQDLINDAMMDLAAELQDDPTLEDLELDLPPLPSPEELFDQVIAEQASMSVPRSRAKHRVKPALPTPPISILPFRPLSLTNPSSIADQRLASASLQAVHMMNHLRTLIMEQGKIHRAATGRDLTDQETEETITAAISGAGLTGDQLVALRIVFAQVCREHKVKDEYEALLANPIDPSLQ